MAFSRLAPLPHRVLWICVLCLVCAGAAVGAELDATDRDGVVTLRNRYLEITCRADQNMIPVSLRTASPDASNLIDLLIISYRTAESKWWYQDNKGNEFGYRRISHTLTRTDAEVRLVITHAADHADDPHFRYTKTIVLRRDRPYVELDYQFECAREAQMTSGISFPSLWFDDGLTHAAFVGDRRILYAGPARELSGKQVEGRWYAAYAPTTKAGLLITFLAERPAALRCSWSRKRNCISVDAGVSSGTTVRPGTRLRSMFVLQPFGVQDPASELPQLAHTTLAEYGLTALKAQRTERMKPRLSFDFHDLSGWETHRAAVVHPAATFKAGDIANAKLNMQRFAWARTYVAGLERRARVLLDKDRAYFEHMIPATTPVSPLFTMCPACEAYPMHGRYRWSADDPDKLVCANCKTLYPNDEYPETLVHVTTWGGGQRLTAYGGKSWQFWGTGHHHTASFLGNIRARKVAHMARIARTAALVYALTDKHEYAGKVREILLRFAEVYPNYLVHTGYNEFADMDPRIAAARITSLPADELTFEPNKPNRKLYPGYWMAGRATGVGMEGGFLTQVAEAYDLTCTATLPNGTNVYTDAERRRIEKDLILEATYLLLHDPGYNNKTASNRRGVGVAGIVAGDPLRVRFGIEGFRHMVDSWHLFDGYTSESIAYGYMTLNGIFPMGEALHGYSDPPGYTFEGQRFDSLDIYADPRYEAVFRAFYNSLLPDLGYPVLADSGVGRKIGVNWAEVMFDRYLDARYLAVLQQCYEGQVAEKGSEYALFHRPVDADVTASVGLALESVFFPAGKVGYLRAGENGLGPTLVLSATDWGGHHHLDGLNLVYHAEGQECLSDLGYLWDSPHKHQTSRTFAHNLVVVDESDQASRARKGNLHLFDDGGSVKVVEASSNAYAQCSEYRRTCFLIDRGVEGVYVVDCFRVAGGKTHDCVLHGPNMNVNVPGGTAVADVDLYDLTDVQLIGAAPPARERAPDGPTPMAPARLSWTLANGAVFDVRFPHTDGELAYLGTGWGQRSHTEKPGAVLPYVVRRRRAEGGPNVFVTVFEQHPAERSFVTGVRIVPAPGNDRAVVVAVRTRRGTEYVISNPDGDEVRFIDEGRTIVCDARAAVFEIAADSANPRETYLLGGSNAQCGDTRVRLPARECGGTVLEAANNGPDSFLVIRTTDLQPGHWEGRWIIVDDGRNTTGYPVIAVKRGPETTKLFTRRARRGFRIDLADTWRLLPSVTLSRQH